MKFKHIAIMGLLAIPANAAVLWNIGIDDGAQDGEGDVFLDDLASFNGVDFNVSGAQETGEQDLPGSPTNTGGASGAAGRDIDDDYYFEGVYSTAAGDGTYTPVGIVSAHESYYDRAITNGDPNMRWHFNLPDTITANDNFTFTIDFYNLDEVNVADVSSYNLTFWVDGKQIGDVQPHLDADIDSAQSWTFGLDDLGGIAAVGSGFDHYVEIRSTPTGSARWASLDYVQLEVSSDPIVEDDPNIAVAAAVNFGDIPIEGSPATETIVFTNSGVAQNLVISDLTLGGNNPTSFSINSPALPITVAPGAQAQIEITVTPGAIEEVLASTLTITSNDTSEATQNVFLSARIFEPFSDEGTLWFVGTDDDGQDGEGDNVFNDPAFFNGVDFFVSGVREVGEDFLPGNPNNQGGLSSDEVRDIDDDFYFAGIYNTVVDGGTYSPVGIVAANERYYDRALTAADPNMRWHFNVPNSVGANDTFTFTIDFFSLSEAEPADTSAYDLTFYVDGQQIGGTESHSDSDLTAAQSWDFTLDDLGGVAELGPGFDHYVEVRSQSVGSAQWASLDYVRLDVVSGGNNPLIITDISVVSPSDDVTFSFQAKVGETYSVDRSTTLLPSGEPGGWSEIEDDLTAQSETQVYTDPGAAAGNDKLFYRVRVTDE